MHILPSFRVSMLKMIVFKNLLTLLLIFLLAFSEASFFSYGLPCGGNFRGIKISCYFEEAIILNFRGC